MHKPRNNQGSLSFLSSEGSVLRGLAWCPVCKYSSFPSSERGASAFICIRPWLGMACGVRELTFGFAALLSFQRCGCGCRRSSVVG